MEKSQHQYQPLQNDESIRILTLDPGQRGDPLTGTLEHVAIDRLGTFEALSYVWADLGPPDSAYDILIRDGDGNKRWLALRGGSIFAALNELRFLDRPRRIWADQCCINQDDQVERSQQLQFMNRIYRDAAHVLVWLGLDTKKEAVPAFSLVREIYGTLCYPIGSVSCELGTVDLERRLKDGKETIQALTDRAWFKRGWIVQEIGTGTPAIIKWGDAEISWDTLASVCEKLKSYHRLRSTLGITTSDICFLFRRFVEPDESTHHANRFNFIYELQRARDLRFSDDRDRVFAFLGHFSARSHHPLACGPVSIAANYTKTVEETYIDVAVRILQANPAALCIVLAAVQHRRDALLTYRRTTFQAGVSTEPWISWKHSLPSWVPDWRWSEGIILAEPICPHQAHGESTTKFKIVEEGKLLILRAHGVEIDTVTACSRPMLSMDFYGKKAPDQPPPMIERLWREILSKKHFNLNDRYLNGQPDFFAFMQTLSNGCVQAAGHTLRPYYDVSDDVWLRKAARYIVETLDASDEISGAIQAAAASAEHENHDEKWSRWATSASEGRIFAKTRGDYYVLGPAALEAGDMVCILFGSKVPFCLRPIGKFYLLVGECYVHGLMRGEAIEMLSRGETLGKSFDII
ncbi:heterokaryon incompatibility protein-domain-containing protein [Xylariaceae sp. AK1471]|nr:heterokaryon incompatibility protein-domain-containing protein [Xylariaceae sp. AK1471]